MQNQTQRVYLVLTEEWFGGEKKTRVFLTKEAAMYYARQVGVRDNLEMSIYEHEILSASAGSEHVDPVYVPIIW